MAPEKNVTSTRNETTAPWQPENRASKRKNLAGPDADARGLGRIYAYTRIDRSNDLCERPGGGDVWEKRRTSRNLFAFGCRMMFFLLLFLRVMILDDRDRVETTLRNPT